MLREKNLLIIRGEVLFDDFSCWDFFLRWFQIYEIFRRAVFMHEG